MLVCAAEIHLIIDGRPSINLWKYNLMHSLNFFYYDYKCHTKISIWCFQLHDMGQTNKIRSLNIILGHSFKSKYFNLIYTCSSCSKVFILLTLIYWRKLPSAVFRLMWMWFKRGRDSVFPCNVCLGLAWNFDKSMRKSHHRPNMLYLCVR